MDELIENHTAYLITLSLVVLFSLFVCGKLNSQRITAERAFWAVWIFLVGSAELVTSFDIFEYPYSINIATRWYTLQFFLTNTCAYTLATLVHRLLYKTRRAKNWEKENIRWRNLTDKRKLSIAVLFLAIGVIEFAMSYAQHGNLLDVRLASLEDTHSGFQLYIYIFYVASAYLVVLGYIDGTQNKISKVPALLTVLGLIFHNLSVGGRINIVLAPLFYMTSYLLYINSSRVYDRAVYYRAGRYFMVKMLYIFAFFSLMGLLRSFVVDFSSVITPEGFLNKVVFVVPKYISDAYVSIAIHAKHALEAGTQLGKFTFDGFYRIMLHFDLVKPVITNEIFGHALYRNTSDPWAWTQTNVIPRLISDFGEDLYVFVYFWVAFLMQWLSIAMAGKDIIRHSIATMSIVCTLYTIQGAMWFSSFTFIILFFCVFLNKVLLKNIKKNIGKELGEQVYE